MALAWNLSRSCSQSNDSRGCRHLKVGQTGCPRCLTWLAVDAGHWLGAQLDFCGVEAGGGSGKGRQKERERNIDVREKH